MSPVLQKNSLFTIKNNLMKLSHDIIKTSALLCWALKEKMIYFCRSAFSITIYLKNYITSEFIEVLSVQLCIANLNYLREFSVIYQWIKHNISSNIRFSKTFYNHFDNGLSVT